MHAQSFEGGVLPTELALLARRRALVFPTLVDAPAQGEPQPGTVSAANPSDPEAFKARRLASKESHELAPTFAGAHNLRPLGLALSGGGIRSATFNLGILQGLAQLDLLKYVDYLSTVSGGGYIGSWLHGVVSHRCEGDPRNASKLLSPDEHPAPGQPKEDPISFLRKYSNYLAPRPGLFSLDTWVIGVIWLRNVLLNQLIIFPAIGVVALVVLMLGMVEQASGDYVGGLTLFGWHMGAGVYGLMIYGSAVLALAALLVALLITNANLRGVAQAFPARGPLHANWVERLVASLDDKLMRATKAVAPLVLVAAILLGARDPGPWKASVLTHFSVGVGVLLLFGLFQIQGGFIECYRKRHKDGTFGAIWRALLMFPTAAAVTTALIFAVWHLVPWWRGGPLVEPWARLAFGPTLVSLSVLAGGTILTGLMGADFPDAAREWLARMAAELAIWCTDWTALFVLVVFAPWAFASLLGRHGPTALTTLGGWALTSGLGVLAGSSGRTNDNDDEGTGRSSVLDFIVGVAPTVFMIGYLLFIALAAHLALRALVYAPSDSVASVVTGPVTVGLQVAGADTVRLEVDGTETSGWLTRVTSPVRTVADDYWHVLSFEGPNGQRQPISRRQRPFWLLAMLAGCGLVTYFASLRFNINEFSMHHFYKNRLVRCYLGASNSLGRAPNPFTGFDSNDDFALSRLVPTDKAPYYGPYPIVNAALNLNAGSELAQQERKAASFVFTPAFCGFAAAHTDADDRVRDKHFERHGYRQTVGYGYPNGPEIGTAMAISGAAANPNSGYHTSGPMAFLLTVFDARLGWWLGNPRYADASALPGPLFALKYLFAELLGLTTARSPFVNLSDGGHFDNLGLYELVRRRCRYIIVGDAEQDGALTFESLGGAIRKCRADFGVEIDIDPTPIYLSPTTRFSGTHCVVGSITYPELETGYAAPFCQGPSTVATERARGWLLYLKSSLTGDEPADVIEYRSRNKDFPHQSTGDQFFSESQFESYRRLGLHVVGETFEDVDIPKEKRGDGHELLQIFQSLAQKWYAPIQVSDEAASHLADTYVKLIGKLGSEPALAGLVPDLFPGAAPAKADLPPPSPETQLFLIEIIQLMQNVYAAFHLEHTENRANPRNAGWMSVFVRWAQSPALKSVWRQVRSDYNPLFGEFMDTHLDETTDVPIRH